jgi:thiol-disulfide isomerase/thioredoxin
MNMRHLSAACIGLLFLSTLATANVGVGDKPVLKFKDFTSKKSVDLADYKGKIIVVDFWATWCNPCMGEAGHMVAVNEKYASKGMQFIGISLDEDPASLKKIIAEKNFTWPQSFEGQAWNGATPKAWGVNSIPQTFIISPEGDVLWRGHPANIDAAIESAFKDHPPQLVDPKVLAAANATLDQVDGDIASQQPAKALKLMAGIPEAAKADGAFASRVTDTTAKLQDFGNSELTSVDPLIASGDFATAIHKLRDLSQAFSGTPVAASAKSKLMALGSNPKVKQALENEKAEKVAADALATANQWKADKKDELAYPQYQMIVKSYPKTAAATDAAAAVKEYEANKPFITAYNNKNNKKKAEGLLLMADNLRQMGSVTKAKEKYQQVLDQYPGTEWAESAKKGMSAITDGQ